MDVICCIVYLRSKINERYQKKENMIWGSLFLQWPPQIREQEPVAPILTTMARLPLQRF